MRSIDDSPGQMSCCTYRAASAASAALIVSVVEFRSAAKAGRYISKAVVQSRMDDDGAKVSDATGRLRTR